MRCRSMIRLEITSRRQDFREIELGFTKIEEIIGRRLPPSAERPQWWANACHGHSGQADCSPIAVAEPVRREADPHDPTGMSRPQCATNIPMEKEVWSCAKDEGRPLASRDQELDANRCKLLPLRAVVVSVAERAGPDPALVRLGETSESKPSMKGRKGIVDVETEVMCDGRRPHRPGSSPPLS
jgi:hypothetical protein